MDKRRTGIFELSSLFGISAEMLRKYENAGLVKPKRGENRYRKYSTWEINKVFFTRKLSLEGFPLRQVSCFFRDTDLNGQIRETEELQAHLEREILDRKRKLDLLNLQKKELSNYVSQGEDVSQELAEELNCCVIEKGELLVTEEPGKDRRRIQEWIAALPYVSLWFIDDGIHPRCSCLAISKREQRQYGLDHLVPDFVLPEIKCAVCNVPVHGNCDAHTSQNAINQALEKVRSKGYQAHGMYRIKMIAYTQNEEQYCCYNKGFFPIER